MNKSIITITLDPDTLDDIRKRAIKNYRTVNKEIAYLINMGIESSNLDIYNVIDFLQDINNGNLDDFNITNRASRLLKDININKEKNDEN
jgi:hypothetical protein